MPFPKNITKEHLLKAIEKIDSEGIPPDGDSQYFDVIYNGKKYPPKVIVSYANLFANGEILNRNTFGGGLGTPSFKLLEKNGFVITEKEKNKDADFYEHLTDFLDVANKQKTGKGTTNEAKIFTQNIPKAYQGLKVDVSFGMGRATAIPWISFLGTGQKTSEGIYPVYLFFKEKNLLILAYGVSEKNRPIVNWNISNSETVEQYFLKMNIGKPDKYGQSFVFKTYDTTKQLDKDDVNKDLSEILNIYKNISFTSNQRTPQTSKKVRLKPSRKMKLSSQIEEFNYLDFYNNTLSSSFFINKNLILRFIASLLTKPFVILTGLSGSGKTKLAQAFAMWISENENQYCIVPVGADWTNREPLLGFPNALSVGDYVKPDNKVLDLIIEASGNIDKPYFLILDEMNLSHVERYFADFLSVMESNGNICLHTGYVNRNDVPSEICLPKNLFIIGTVNIDETTYMFSPKVLDRANVIEFRVTADEMEAYLGNNKVLNVDSLKSAGANMAEAFVKIAKDKTIAAANTSDLNKALIAFFTELKKTGAEFGYRSAAEILRFAAVVNRLEPAWSMNEIIDAAIMQKLMPKVHGSRRKLEPVLKIVGTLCLENGQNIDDYISSKTEMNFLDSDKIKYPISLEKILRMFHNLISNGFTSYAEA